MVISHDVGILHLICNTIDNTFTWVRIEHTFSLDTSEMDQYVSTPLHPCHPTLLQHLKMTNFRFLGPKIFFQVLTPPAFGRSPGGGFHMSLAYTFSGPLFQGQATGRTTNFPFRHNIFHKSIALQTIF